MTQTADFHFIHRTPAGQYRDVNANGIAVDDLDHAARKVRATCIKNHCQYNGVAGYMPYGFVKLDGRTYRVDVYRDGSTSVKELAQ